MLPIEQNTSHNWQPHMHSSVRTSPSDTLMNLIRITSTVLAVYWVAIFVATHLPGSSLPNLGSDKLYHLGAFFGLSVLLSWALSQRITRAGTLAVTVLAISIAYALFDEWSQQFVPHRTPDLNDALADSCGAALGVILFGLTMRVGRKAGRFTGPRLKKTKFLPDA